MMQQELLQEEQPAAQVRVTAEELAQAVAAVEARDTAPMVSRLRRKWAFPTSRESATGPTVGGYQARRQALRQGVGCPS
jgi:hypothetical protein